MSTIDSPPKNNSVSHASSPAAIPYVAAFLVVAAAFLVHFNLVHAPLQGRDFELFLFDDLLHQPESAAAAHDRLPASPLALFVLALLWQLGKDAALLRSAGLLLHVLGAAAAFQALRAWLGRSNSIAAPLLGALLFAASPAATWAIADAAAWPALLSTTMALAAFLLVTRAGRKPNAVQYPALLGACCLLAAAAAAQHFMLVLPVVFLALDALRPKGEPRLPLHAHLCLFGAAAATGMTAHFSGSSIIAAPPSAPYLLSALVALAAARLIAAAPPSLLQKGLVALAALTTALFSAYSFQQGMRRVEPAAFLERQIEANADPGLLRELALHYYFNAEAAADPEARTAMLLQAATTWQACRESQTLRPEELNFFGNALHALGQTEQALEIWKQVLDAAPFSKLGRNAALAMARAKDEQTHAKEIADLYALLSREGMLSTPDSVHYARALMLLGDLTAAATTLSALPELEDGSKEAALKQQAVAIRNAALTLQEKARKELNESPTNAAGIVASAESNLMSGNFMRAFYMLELALRKDPAVERGWDLMGILCASRGADENFMRQWGALRSENPAAWLALARRVAMAQSWDAALAYAQQGVSDATPSAEEYMAAFAMEMKRTPLAVQWLEKAAQARPQAYAPWLALCDIAMASSAAPRAQQMLEEAAQRNAPEDELQKRRSHMDAEPNQDPSSPAPFEPVRTLIQ